MLFPINKHPNSTSRNEGFVKKKHALTTPKNYFDWQKYIYKRQEWLHLNLNNGFL